MCSERVAWSTFFGAPLQSLRLPICLSTHPPEASDVFIKGCLEHWKKQCSETRPGLANLSINSSSGSFRRVHKGLPGALNSAVLEHKAWTC